MRALISVVALVAAAFIVLKLTGTQLQALKSATAPVAGSGAAPGPAPNAAQQAASTVQRALEQGAAQRAADAASR